MADALTQLIQMAQTLEFILAQRYQAEGRGLHEKLTSVESEIPKSARKQIRFVATIRNKATHEDVTLAEEKLEAVTSAYRKALAALDGKNVFDAKTRPVVENYDLTYGLTLDAPPRNKPKLDLRRRENKRPARNNVNNSKRGNNTSAHNNNNTNNAKRDSAPQKSRVDLTRPPRKNNAKRGNTPNYANNAKRANTPNNVDHVSDTKGWVDLNAQSRDRVRSALLLGVVGGLLGAIATLTLILVLTR